MLYADDLIICWAFVNIPATVPSPKVNPAGSANNPDGTHSPADIPAYERGFLEKPSLTVRIEPCNCSATTNGHTM
jgi:hypothetical protein